MEWFEIRDDILSQVTINRLQPGTTYEFQVNSKNTIGEGMMSKAITIRTLGKSKISRLIFDTVTGKV